MTSLSRIGWRLAALTGLLGAVCASLATPGSGDEPGEASASGGGGMPSWEGRTVVVVLADGDFTDGRSVRELERLLRKAEENGAAAVVFEVDIRRGAPWDPHQRVVDLLSGVRLPTATFVNSTATGAGALVALAGEAIYLTPAGIIGGGGLEELPRRAAADRTAAEIAEESELTRRRSVLKAKARSLSRLRGHRPDVAEALVDAGRELRLGDEVLSAEGEVLTLTADEAAAEFEGAPVLAHGVVDSLEEAIREAGFPAEHVRYTPGAFGSDLSRARLSASAAADPEEVAERLDAAEDADAAAAAPEPGEAADPDEAAEEEARRPLFGRRDEGTYKGKILVIEVGEDTLATGKASFEFMDRVLRKAELDGAAAVIFDMDTPGGFAWHTDGLVLNSLQSVTYPTYTFVNSRALSAGAIVAVGTDHIYMRPGATIGSALVVGAAGQDLGGAMEDKVTQMLISSVRTAAELKGHNPDVAEAFVTREKEVRIGGEVIHESGNVLTLNTIRATEEVGGRPLLAKGVARSLEEIVEREGLQGELVEARPLGMEAFAHWVQKLSVLLIVVGLAGAYMEMNSPGFGLPGLASVLAFSIFFFGNYLAGNLAGYELAVLLALGLMLVLTEIFVFPGAILPGALGGALMLFALGLAMVDRVDFEWKISGLPGAETWFSLFRNAFLTVGLGLAGAVAAMFAAMRYLPETRLGSRFVLQQAIAGGASIADRFQGEPAGEGAQDSAPRPEAASLLGKTGRTSTRLMPSGKGVFDGRLFDIVTDGDYLDKDEEVRVVRHEGSIVVVAKA